MQILWSDLRFEKIQFVYNFYDFLQDKCNRSFFQNYSIIIIIKHWINNVQSMRPCENKLTFIPREKNLNYLRLFIRISLRKPLTCRLRAPWEFVRIARNSRNRRHCAVYRDGEYQGVDVPDCRGRACLPRDQIPKITNEIPPSYFCFRNSIVKTPSASRLELVVCMRISYVTPQDNKQIAIYVMCVCRVYVSRKPFPPSLWRVETNFEYREYKERDVRISTKTGKLENDKTTRSKGERGIDTKGVQGPIWLGKEEEDIDVRSTMKRR